MENNKLILYRLYLYVCLCVRAALLPFTLALFIDINYNFEFDSIFFVFCLKYLVVYKIKN